MKLKLSTSPLIASENMSSSVMGMDSSGLDQACYFLRDKIYSDKILAVVREYVCNALDEHIKYKVDRAVDFGLRGDGEIEFFVRDYAKGLSEQEIRNVFGMYFKSTKRDNNIQSGSFGLGSKAAHCYTDTFYVKSRYNGVCTLYACALGGGNTGVPVGHILKVSEEETSESGLEVYLSIKSNDRFSFTEKSRDFVSFCSQKINYHQFNDVYVPETPVATIQKNGFGFRFFDASKDRHLLMATCTKLLMGDVSYSWNYVRYKKAHFGQKIMVVDVPIGKMTLPISRENFEDTPNNQRVRAEIEKTINEIIEEDISSIAPMTIEELLKTREEPELKGKYFSIYKRDVYADIYPFIRDASTVGHLSAQNHETHKGKMICAYIKSSKQTYWIDKLYDLGKSNNKKYYVIDWSILNQCNIDKLSEVFELRNVKSAIFNYPKTEGDKKDSLINEARLVYIKNAYGDYRNYHWTPLEVYNYMATAFSLEEVATVDEAAEKIAELSFDSLKKLNAFTVAKANSTSGRVTTVTRSKSMQKALIELGFFDVESQEYKDKLAELQKIEVQKQEAQNAISAMNKKFLHADLAKQIIEKAQKNIKFAKKAKCVFDQISKENSIRGKIINSIEGSVRYWYSNNPQLTRQELRQILRMK